MIMNKKSVKGFTLFLPGFVQRVCRPNLRIHFHCRNNGLNKIGRVAEATSFLIKGRILLWNVHWQELNKGFSRENRKYTTW
ncbi:hypothetical protein Dda3937_00550 [Dickeya dadantii 3937]|uniref:Uncharacterized protein n=1 Tax=Dickeya dadantii (strain 3937) TaxID=198628 RepID=E0SJP8_DICD3|nr:hypothetical protein Dda3937_00550 [Dickeya dadantii 3937]